MGNGVSMKRSRKARKGLARNPFLVALAALAALVVLIEWVAPPFVLKSLNRSLNKNPAFQNHVEGLDINLLRGGYTLKDFEIRRLWKDSSLPIFTAKSIDVSLKWTGFFRGRVTGEITLHEPAWHVVKQLPRRKKRRPLSQILQWFYPFPIDRLQVRGGSIHYQDFEPAEKGQAPIHVFADRFEGDARGLASFQPADSGTRDTSRRASAWITARAMGQSPVKIEMTMVPGARYPDLDVRASLDDFPLAALNPLFRAYGKLDVEAGTVGFTSRIRASDGRFQGILRPRLLNLKILDEKNDGGFFQETWETFVDAAGRFLEKEKRVVYGSERPLSGSFIRPDQDEWRALGALWIGAFAHSLDPRLGKLIPYQEGLRWDILESQK
jgi:hypothetical protein